MAGDVTGERPAAERTTDRRSERELDRLVFFSDGVMAIAITLLVLKIEIPEFDGTPSTADLGDAVVDLIPNIITFVWSFMLVALFWSLHRRLFSGLARLDARLVWLNSVFLLLIALLPFPSDLLGRFGPSLLSIALFAGLIALTGVVITVMQHYTDRHAELLDPELHVDRHDLVDGLLTPAVFLLSIGIAAFDANLAAYSWFLLALRRPLRQLRHRPAAARTTPSGR